MTRWQIFGIEASNPGDYSGRVLGVLMAVDWSDMFRQATARGWIVYRASEDAPLELESAPYRVRLGKVGTFNHSANRDALDNLEVGLVWGGDIAFGIGMNDPISLALGLLIERPAHD